MGQFDYSLLKSCGEDVYISDKAIIKRTHLFVVGNHVAIDEFCVFTPQVELSDYIHIAPLCTVIGGPMAKFTMGHFSTMAAGCRIICRGDRHMGDGLISPVIPDQYRDTVTGTFVTLEPFASLATNVTVYPDVVIREGAVVLAGSVVTESTEPWTVYRGVPAKPFKKRPSEKMKSYARLLGYDF